MHDIHWDKRSTHSGFDRTFAQNVEKQKKQQIKATQQIL